MASNGSKNGKTQKDILLTLLDDVRDLRGTQESMQKAQESMQKALESMQKAQDATNKALAASIETTARMIGGVEALIDATGRNEAEIDDLKRRVTRLEADK